LRRNNIYGKKKFILGVVFLKKAFFGLMLCLSVIFSCAVAFGAAPTVTLLEPNDNAKVNAGTEVEFKFKLEWDTSETLELCQLWSDRSGTWQSELTNDSISSLTSGDETLSFKLTTSTTDDDFKWNVMCKYQNTNDEGWGANNRTLKINHAPAWTKNIDDQTIDEDSGTTTIGDISSYATDSDSDTLSFSISAENTSEVDCSVDSNGKNLKITPAANFYGTASCTVKVSDGSLSAEDTFSITVNAVQDTPTWKTIDKQKLDPDSTKTLDLSQYASDVDGDSLSFSVLTQANTNIAECSISGSTLTISTVGKTHAGETSCVIQVDDGHGNKVNTTVEIDSGKLIFEDINIKVAEGTEKDLQDKEDGYKLDKKAEPNSTIEIKFRIQNIFDESTDIEIDDIVLTATLEEMGDEDEQEEEVDIGGLEPDEKSERETVTFDVPLFLDEGTYELKLELEGIDDNDVKHVVTKTFKIAVDKENHDLRIIDAAVYPSKLTGDGRLRFDVEVANAGARDEDDVLVKVMCSGLDIEIEHEIDELESDWEDDDNCWEGTLYANVKNATPGTYTITFAVYRKNGDRMDEREVEITIAESKPSVAEEEEEETVEVQTIDESATAGAEAGEEEVTTGAETEGGFMSTVETSFRESDSYKAILIGCIIIVCVLIVMIFVFGFRR